MRHASNSHPVVAVIGGTKFEFDHAAMLRQRAFKQARPACVPAQAHIGFEQGKVIRVRLNAHGVLYKPRIQRVQQVSTDVGTDVHERAQMHSVVASEGGEYFTHLTFFKPSAGSNRAADHLISLKN